MSPQPPDPPPAPEPNLDPRLLAHFAQPLLERLRQFAGSGERRVLALNGPVGAGKTTLCRLLHRQAQAAGLALAVASIDDFYLLWAERGRRLRGNPFGVSRVPPGSHDAQLLHHCLASWQAGGDLVLPRFDKTLRQGQGDRCGAQRLRPDVLLLEGWLLGCTPLGPAALEGPPAAALAGLTACERAWLPRWDQALAAYQPAWARCHELWLLRPDDWSWPRRWRFQAEARQRRRGGSWLAPAQLEGLVRASLCSLPPALYQQPLEARAVAVAHLDGRRRCRAVSGAALEGQPSSDASSVVG